jgi:predicted permease
VAYFSEKELGIAIIYDQVNFMIFATAGIIVAINSAHKTVLSVGVIVKRLVRFPPFIGCVAALILPHFINLQPVEPLFDKLTVTVGPLALFSIGLQIKFQGWQNHLNHISAALLYKLVLAPAIILSIVWATGLKGTIAQISIFESAMPPLLTAGIVADEYGLNPELTSLIIGIGIMLSFITTGLWWLVLHYWV